MFGGTKPNRILLGIALLAGSVLSGAANAAPIVGETVRIDYLFPDTGTVSWSSGDVVVVDPGVEWTLGPIDVDIWDGFITVENATVGWSEANHNGLRFTDVLGTIDDFTSFALVSISGNVPPIDPVLSFAADELLVNFTPTGAANLAADPGMLYTFSFSTTPAIPEPTAALVFGVGFGLVGWSIRRRMRA